MSSAPVTVKGRGGVRGTCLPIPQSEQEWYPEGGGSGGRRRTLRLQAGANTGISGGSLCLMSKQMEMSRKQAQARHLSSASGISTERECKVRGGPREAMGVQQVL